MSLEILVIAGLMALTIVFLISPCSPGCTARPGP